MKDTPLLKRISIDTKVMLGKPVIKGTRLTVEHILEKLAYGERFEEVIAAYPILKKKDISAALLYAARAVAAEKIVAVSSAWNNQSNLRKDCRKTEVAESI